MPVSTEKSDFLASNFYFFESNILLSQLFNFDTFFISLSQTLFLSIFLFVLSLMALVFLSECNIFLRTDHLEGTV